MSFFAKLRAFLRGGTPPRFRTQIRDQLAMRPADEQRRWGALLDWCEEAKQAAPTQKWAKEAKARLDAVGSAAYLDAVKAWFSETGRYGFEHSADLVKGLVWCSTFVDDAALSTAIGDLGEAAFKKVKGEGPLCVRVGNACVWALGASPALHATAQLSRLKAATKYRHALERIDRAVTHAAEERGVSKEALEELAAPSFEGTLPAKLGAWSPQLRFEDGSLDVSWVRDDGKAIAGVPAEVKRDHAGALAAMKEQLKSMEKLLPGHVARLEHLFVSDRALTVDQWRAHYVEHGLVGFLARPLVWRFDDAPGVWLDGEVLGAGGERFEVPAAAEVRLWHPLGRAPEEVAALKVLATKLKLLPPFKQVDRETFALSEIEASSGLSMRWAGRRLKQHQFHALCRARGWDYRLMGGFDSFNTPTREVRAWALQAELNVDAVDDQTTSAGIFVHVVTGQVRLMRRELPLAGVPPVVLSEVLRDVELFVSVCAA